jgi:hypothetical protein
MGGTFAWGRRARIADRGGKRKSLLFLKKKKQKDFIRLTATLPVSLIERADGRNRKRGKVFWFFFSKKNTLPCLPSTMAHNC